MFDRKKMLLLCFLFVLVGSLFMMVFEAANAAASTPGDLACDDLSACKTSASCNGPGTPVECMITCDGGAVITCPKK